MRRYPFQLFFIFFICSISLNLYSEEKMRIAVLSLEGKNVTDVTASAVTDMVTTEIVNTGVFVIIERNQMQSILKEQGLQMTGCTDQSCAVQIGKLLSAEKILMGSISRIEKEFVINVRLVDVERGIAEFAAMEKAETESMLSGSARRIAQKIAGEVEEKVPKKKVFSKNEYYMKGIIPGWGQIYAGSSTKGYIFMGSFLAAGALALYGVMDFNTKRDDYMNLPDSSTQSEFDKKNDAKNKAGLFAFSMVSITALIYAANWVDLVFFTKLPDAASAADVAYARDIFINTGVTISTLYAGENQYRVEIGRRF